jgi:hypothetical protein
MQNFTQIQQAFDTKLLTVPGITASNVTIYTENEVLNFLKQPDISGLIGIRTTLVPTKTIVETMGVGSYVSVNGFYAVDVFGPVNKGYATVSTMADAILATFAHGQQLNLVDGDVITLGLASPGTSNQGAWSMNKLYCRQVIVEFFGYVQP